MVLSVNIHQIKTIQSIKQRWTQKQKQKQEQEQEQEQKQKHNKQRE